MRARFRRREIPNRSYLPSTRGLSGSFFRRKPGSVSRSVLGPNIISTAIAGALASMLLLCAGAATQTSDGKFAVALRSLQLENGLRVVLSKDNLAPVVAVAVYYDVGSRNEVKGRSGFAHLFEHMMFQGSENVPKAGHFKYVENNGGELQGSTHDDYTNYYELMPSSQLELALWLESDRMRSLKITAENLKNQQEAVKEEKRLSIDNQPYSAAYTTLDEMVFSNWANAHPTMGSMKDLDAARLTDVREFFDTYYAPNNAVLVIAGDIDYSETEALVRKYFSTIARHKDPPAPDLSEPEAVSKRQFTVSDLHAQVPALAMEWKIPGRGSPDRYALSLLKSILLDGKSSRLYQKLVKEKAVCLEVEGSLDLTRGPSDIAILSVHKANIKASEVQAIIESEVDKLRKEGVGAEELARVKNQYRLSRFIGDAQGDQYSGLDTALGRALALAEFTLFDRDPSLINSDLDRYLEVSADQVRAAAVKYLGTVNRSVLYIRPSTPNRSPRPAHSRKSAAARLF
jgi:zinc protease